MSTFQDRFVRAFNEEAKRRVDAGEPRLTKTMVWKAAKATSGAFTQWHDGTTGMNLDKCFLVAPLLRVNPRWLFDESEPMRPADSQATETTRRATPAESPIHADYVQLEIHDVRMSAGAGAECPDRSDIVANLPVLKSWALENLGTANPEYVKLVTCAGISMQPTIDDGSLLFVDVRVREFRGDGIYCLAWNDHLVVKRLIADVLSGNLRIVSDNPDKELYPDQIATPREADRLIILGQVRRWFKTCKP